MHWFWFSVKIDGWLVVGSGGCVGGDVNCEL